jgi:predicted amidohydrolase
MESAKRLLHEVGKQETDIACLPELFLGSQVPHQPIPGPMTEEIGKIAEEYHMYVIAPTFIETSDGKKYNANVLLSREGDVLGFQPKMHLWPWEGVRSITQPPFQGPGVIPGSDWIVFDLDFGKIGSYICHDHCFPEAARMLALRGAEIIFCTTRMPDPFQIPWKEISIVRAIENQVYVVSVGAHYNDCSTHIVSPRFRGGVLVETGLGERAITTNVNLTWLEKERKDSPIYYIKSLKDIEKSLKNIASFCYFKDRRPEIYGDISKKQT